MFDLIILLFCVQYIIAFLLNSVCADNCSETDTVVVRFQTNIRTDNNTGDVKFIFYSLFQASLQIFYVIYHVLIHFMLHLTTI